jgi:tight adherence protein C
MSQSLLLPIIVGTMIGLAVLIFGVAIRDREGQIAKEATRDLLSHYTTGRRAYAGFEAEGGSRLRLHLAPRIAPASARRRMRQQLAIAGRAEADGVERMVRRKLLFLVLGTALGLLVSMRLGGLGWLALPIGVIGGFYLPDLLIRSAGDKRTDELRKALPDALDLMQLCVGSGLGLQAALQQVADTQDGPVAAELGRVLQEMHLGISRADAFIGLTQRVRQPDLVHFAHAMIQVDRLGISISTVLDEQAKEMREKRQSAAEEKAQKVAVKILGPLVACFLPALFIIVIGPAVLRLIRTFAG